MFFPRALRFLCHIVFFVYYKFAQGVSGRMDLGVLVAPGSAPAPAKSLVLKHPPAANTFSKRKAAGPAGAAAPALTAQSLQLVAASVEGRMDVHMFPPAQDDDTKSVASTAIASLGASASNESSGSSTAGSWVECIRCVEQVEFGLTAPYGRNPFNRICDCCSTSYRCKMNLIAKQKKANGGKSEAEVDWKKLKHPEQVAWYRQQKREAKDKHKHRELDMVVEVNDCTVNNHNRGRRRVNRLTSWGTFLKNGVMIGKSPLDLQAEWRELLLNPEVEREQTMVNGRKELCLELFHAIEKYEDESEGRTWGSNKRIKVDNAETLQEELDRQAREFEESRGGTDMSMNLFAPIAPDVSSNVEDIDVPAHMLPTPMHSSLFVRPPSTDRPSSNQLLRELQKREQVEKQAELDLKTQIADLSHQRQEDEAKKSKGARLCNEKTVVLAKAVVVNYELSVQDKIDTLEREAAAAKSTMEDSSHPKKDEMMKSITSAFEKAKNFVSGKLQLIADQLTFFDKEGKKQPDEVKAVKNEVKLIVAEVTAEGSEFKIGKFAIDQMSKQITAYVRRQNKANVSKAQAELENRKVLSENPFASSVLGMQAQSPVLQSGNQSQISDCWPLCVAIKDKALMDWGAKQKTSSFVKSQKGFLLNWLAKNESHSTQESTMSVKVLCVELGKIISQICGSISMLPPDDYKPGKAELELWKKSYQFSVVMSVNHSTVGVATYGLGECFFGLEG